jgi:phenylacetate-CoA ligase
MSESPYFEEAIETLPREELEKLQLARFRATVDRALKTSFYGERLPKLGIKSGADIRSLSDIATLPFTSKYDFRESFPYGMLAVPREDVVRLHASSGTTGRPTVVYYTQNDLDYWAELCARSMYGTGARKTDVFQNMTGYGLFTGGLGMNSGSERLGMLTIPMGTGNTIRQLQFMRDFKVTVVHATPSYLLHMAEKMGECGFSGADLCLKRAFIGAEPHSEDMRKKIESIFGIKAFNSYGLSEMNGPGVAFECEREAGMHLWEDAYYLEIVDPETGRVLPDGEVGELVLTPINREATQLIRYRTRDLTRVIPEKCECGRSHRRIARFRGRSDDMLIINGVNVFPSQIEEVLMAVREVANNYLILVSKDGALDRLTVKVEVTDEVFSDDARDMNELKRRVEDRLTALITIHPRVEFHSRGSLPQSEGKAKRVVDERPKDQ